MAIIFAGIMGAACSYIASSKHKNELLWFFLGFLFNIIALTLILILPDAHKPPKIKTDQYNPHQYEDYM